MDSQKKESPNSKGAKKEKSKKKKRKITVKRILVVFLILLICAAAGVTGVVLAIVQSAPSLPSGDLLDELTQSSQIYDSKENYVEDLSSSDIRQIVFLNEIPENLKDAYIAIEDKRFNSHMGVDIKRIFGALLNNIKNKGISQGASTITQQLVKNILLTRDQTYKRKIQEAYLAIQMEQKYDKNEILEAYLNTVWVGGNNYGVEAGAQYYFGKSVGELNLAECALLAGINQNAGIHDPYNELKIKGIKDRLSTMLESGAITQEEYDTTVQNIKDVFANLLETQDYDAYKTNIKTVTDFMRSKDPKIISGSAAVKASREEYYDDLANVSYRERQVITLGIMRDLGMISQEEYDEAVNYKLVFTGKEKFASASKHQWFIEPAVDQIIADYAEQYDVDESEASRIIRTGGYKIFLTMDSDIQDKAETVMNTDSLYPKGFDDYALNPDDDPLPQPQGATVVMETTTGKVVAVVGGRGKQPERSYNRATDKAVARQVGSSIKPLAVYTPALEKGIAMPGTAIEDSPLTAEQVKSYGWDPQNYDDVYRGYTTVREAVKWSINSIAVKLQMKVGNSTSLDYLMNKFHISTLVTSGKYNDSNPSSLALGGLTYGATPLEMTAAYATLGNGGVYSEPIFYTQVVDKYGNVVLEKTTKQSKEISEQASYVMTDMLKTVVQSGTATSAQIGSQPVAGKTGTTDDRTNGWFIGYTPYYTCSIWIGHDNKTVRIPNLGGAVTGKYWKGIMQTAHKDLPVKDFTKPDGIVAVPVCIDSGKAPSDLCKNDPRGSRVITELFIKGSEPVQICDVHTSANVDKSTGLLATEFCPAELVENKVFITRTTAARVKLQDDDYVLPTEYCTTHTHAITPTPTPTPEVTPPHGGKDKPTPTPSPAPSGAPTVSPTSNPGKEH